MLGDDVHYEAFALGNVRDLAGSLRLEQTLQNYNYQRSKTIAIRCTVVRETHVDPFKGSPETYREHHRTIVSRRLKKGPVLRSEKM